METDKRRRGSRHRNISTCRHSSGERTSTTKSLGEDCCCCSAAAARPLVVYSKKKKEAAAATAAEVAQLIRVAKEKEATQLAAKEE